MKKWGGGRYDLKIPSNKASVVYYAPAEVGRKRGEKEREKRSKAGKKKKG